MTFILIVFCIVGGIALIKKPDMLWELEHFLSVKHGEPTDFYLVYKRIIGIFLLCSGIIGIVVTIIF